MYPLQCLADAQSAKALLLIQLPFTARGNALLNCITFAHTYSLHCHTSAVLMMNKCKMSNLQPDDDLNLCFGTPEEETAPILSTRARNQPKKTVQRFDPGTCHDSYADRALHCSRFFAFLTTSCLVSYSQPLRLMSFFRNAHPLPMLIVTFHL